MKKAFSTLGLLFLLSMNFAGNSAKAQTGFPDDTLDNPVPFDAGVLVLVIIGVLYGFIIAFERKKIEKL